MMINTKSWSEPPTQNSLASPALTALLPLQRQDTSLRSTVSNTESNWIERIGKGELVGYCDFASCEKVTGAIRPVPAASAPSPLPACCGTRCPLPVRKRALRSGRFYSLFNLDHIRFISSSTFNDMGG